MTTAFQRNAFQFHAFQIDLSDADTHDGIDSIPRRSYLPIYVGRGDKQQPLGNIIRIYDKAKELPDTQKLLSIIEPFVEIQTREDLQKRAKAERIVDKLPNIERIDINNLIKNQLAIDLLLNEIEQIRTRLELQSRLNQEDDLLLILISACV